MLGHLYVCNGSKVLKSKPLTKSTASMFLNTQNTAKHAGTVHVCVLPSVHDITNNRQQIIHISPRLTSAFPTPPIIAYSRPKNLRSILVRTDTSNPSYATPGNHAAMQQKTLQDVPHSTKPNIIHQHFDRQNIQHKTHATCITYIYIYIYIFFFLIPCRRCNIQYVRETQQQLSERMNGHRSDIKRRESRINQ